VTALAMPGGAAPRTQAPRRIPGEEGIWVFVLGDMTVFALFFATFMYSRGKNPHAFSQDHHSLNVTLGTANTVLLLSSSLFVAVGVTRVMAGNHRAAFGLFATALGCGGGFVMIKTVEWSHLFLAGKSVGNSEYFSYYFMFTGIHLMHVLIGAAVLCRLIWLTRQPELSERQRTMCETGGIFWHMVDLLWVVLFALFYLLG
jgi:nitric oxide reductase NorE protein